MSLYYDFETEEYLTRSDLFGHYMQEVLDKTQDYNSTFEHYTESCLYRNNGSLYPLDEWISKLEREVNKLTVSEETIDDYENLIPELRKAYTFRSAHSAPLLFPDEIAEALRDFEPGTEIRLYFGPVWKGSRFVPDEYDPDLCAELYELTELGYSILIGRTKLTDKYAWR